MDAANVVVRSGRADRPVFTTGGFVAGAKPYAVANWKEVASTSFPRGKFTLLAGEGEQVRLGEVFARRDGRERWDGILASRFAAVAEILGGQLPTVDIKFRLVPAGVKYRFTERQPFNGFEAISLELLAVIPPSGELDRDWLLTQTMTAAHELFHVLRKDLQRFPRSIARPEEEIEAYFVGMCSSLIASNQIPVSLFAFPKTMEDAVDPGERDILIRDVYEQMLEQKGQPTVIGVNVSMLAFFRYLEELKKGGLVSPGAGDSLPLCNAAARDQLHWAEADIDLQIAQLAKQAANRVR